MIVRLVHLSLRLDQVEPFLALFERSKAKIKASRGCLYLALLQEIDQPDKVSTLSHWDNEQSLNAYRNSEFFRETWAASKVMFSDRAVAQSYQILTEVNSMTQAHDAGSGKST